MVHFASQNNLVDPLPGASIHAFTASEKTCSLIAEVLGAKHEGLRTGINLKKFNLLIKFAIL